MAKPGPKSGPHETAGPIETAIPGDVDIQLVVKGVTTFWLAQAFGMDIRTVNTRLRECPALKKKVGGTGIVYDLATAAQYLVTPKFDVAQYLQTAKIDEMPAKFQTEFWGAALKRQTWEERADKLWAKEKVAKMFSETFLMAANNMTMWVSNIEARVEMSPAIRAALEEEVRNLQAQIAVKIKAMPRLTPSQKAEMREEVKPAPVVEDDDDDFDISSVV